MKHLYCAWLVLVLGCAIPVLATAQELPHDAELLKAARAANQVHQRHLESLRRDLQSEETVVQARAIEQLARTNDPSVVPFLMPFLDADVHEDELVEAAILALTALRVDIAPQLRALVNDHERFAEEVYNGLARLKRWGTEDWRQRSSHENEALRASAITNLGDNEHGAGEILAEAMLNDKSPHIRRMATIGLGRLQDPAYGNHFSRALTDPNPRVRRYAAEALSALNYTEAIPNLLMAMQTNVAGAHLNRALMQMTGQDFGFDHRASATSRQQAIDEAFVWYTVEQAGQR